MTEIGNQLQQEAQVQPTVEVGELTDTPVSGGEVNAMKEEAKEDMQEKKDSVTEEINDAKETAVKTVKNKTGKKSGICSVL